MFVVVDGGVFNSFIFEKNPKYMQFWLYILANERNSIVEFSERTNGILSRQQTRTFVKRLVDMKVAEVLPTGNKREGTRLRLLNSSLFGSKYAKRTSAPARPQNSTVLQPVNAGRAEQLTNKLLGKTN